MNGPFHCFLFGFCLFFQFYVCLVFCDSWGCFHGDEPQPAFLMSPWSLKTIDSRNVRTSVTWSLHCTSVPFTFLKNYKRSLGGLSFVCLFVCFPVCVRVCAVLVSSGFFSPNSFSFPPFYTIVFVLLMFVILDSVTLYVVKKAPLESRWRMMDA